jgi:catechol 2,3-dioxygenase-like lactoylglutathione lyase family enzyme
VSSGERHAMEINGIAHIQLTVNDLARAMPFYEEVLGFMGMKAVVKNPEFLYMIGGRSAVAIARCSPENRDAVFDQRRIGLHHVCFRARSREDVDAIHEFLRTRSVKIVRAPILFEDPDGIRLEVNFVPGKGHLEDPQRLPLSRLPE